MNLWDLLGGKLQESYAQEGEDLVLARIFERFAPVGRFYVDVGAHHPVRFSNTYRFYRHGWRGINIEPNPDVAPEFARRRPRDINLMAGVGRAAGTLPYIRFNEPALNTFDEAWAQKTVNATYRIVDRLPVTVERLDTLLARHVPPSQQIDFLNVDVEGRDLEVLESSDWSRWRPGVVLIEDHEFELEAPARSAAHAFMTRNGYRLFAKTFYTLFYLRS